MSFMRLGTRIAVINEKNEILLSKRGDSGVWALPGGRVDSGEILHESAIREVREETGLDVEIERPIGLYFQQGRSRMNILYRAKPIGGELFKATDETLDNRFFSPDKIPADLFGQFYIDHAFTNDTRLYTIETPFLELLKIDLKLRWRWIQNLLAGRPEPKFTRFTVRVVAVIWHDGKILVQDDNLPCVISDGSQSLPDSVSKHLNKKLDWQWVGICQETSSNTIDFVFHSDANLKNKTYKSPQQLTQHQQLYTQISEKVWHIS